MTIKPLNPTLYRLLEMNFGEVGIVSEGQEISWDVVSRRLLDSRVNGQNRKVTAGRRIHHSGEEYKVNCPFCNDQRMRLYINHRWAVFDEETGSHNLFLAQCFNEGCVDSAERQRQLQELVFSSARSGRMRILPGKKSPSRVTEVSPPGPMLDLATLTRNHPRHPAILYLRERGFDPEKISQLYGVYYCPSSKYSLAQHRLICTMRQDGRLVGWQARYIGTPPDKRIPKYWSCPGMARRLLAYNYDQAVLHHTIPIVEGPTDVWNMGPMSMGLIGKTMNPSLQRRFTATLQEKGTGQVVPVILDPEQDETAKRKGKPHHIEKLVNELRPKLGDRVFGIYLPEGYDPGSLDRDFLREVVKREAGKRGLTARFKKPELS